MNDGGSSVVSQLVVKVLQTLDNACRKLLVFSLIVHTGGWLTPLVLVIFENSHVHSSVIFL